MKEKMQVQRFGAILFRGFAQDLYEDPVFVVREYVSNSIDGEASSVSVTIVGPKFDLITIKDDGKGFSRDELVETLNSIGISPHADTEGYIGEHGIGLYSGTAICKTIKIRTKQNGNVEGTEATIPVGTWVELAESAVQMTLQEMAEYEVADFTDEEHVDESYTIVQLIDLKPSAITKILNRTHKKSKTQDPLNDFREELGNIIPVAFPDDFPHKEDILTILRPYQVQDKNFGRTCDVLLNGELVLKPLPDTNEQFEHLVPIELELIDAEGMITVGWCLFKIPGIYKSGKRKGQRKKGEQIKNKLLRGIQIRKMNVEVYGRDQVAKMVGDIGKKESVLKWVTGEINVLSPEIKTTQRRKEFRESEEWTNCKELLLTELTKIIRIARQRYEKAPATVVVEEAPATVVVEETPATAVVEEAPATAVVEEVPATAVVEGVPATAVVEEVPATATIIESENDEDDAELESLFEDSRSSILELDFDEAQQRILILLLEVLESLVEKGLFEWVQILNVADEFLENLEVYLEQKQNVDVS